MGNGDTTTVITGEWFCVALGPVPACFFVLAMYFVHLFPINKSRHEANTATVIAERKKREAAHLEGKTVELVEREGDEYEGGLMVSGPGVEGAESNKISRRAGGGDLYTG